MRILYRHALDVIEKQQTFLRHISLDELSELERQAMLKPGAGIDGDLQEQVVQREELHKALVQLNADQRRVIALR